MSKAEVGIIMGSTSDLDIMEEAARVLESFGIDYDMTISSGHRSPERTIAYARSARERGIRVIIVGAGGAAHLAGTIAALTTLPVIGVPIHSSPLGGLDALLSTVQMPSGVAVATMAVGQAGAKNAAILATQILALSNLDLEAKLAAHKEQMEEEVAQAAEESLQSRPSS
ncbi:MAG: 5-(carboxyamino)imidazole ribonucleotide mutase [Nitrospinae bacterium]|nr:5-(carboxyamino)imidazole ribonucleotide mutase [Nitrospinota bacterium]